ncbi:CD63 antigen [Gasterosteus aculeatus]|uniref:Tetraspanin n=1 Tax=Gasterosteus aculeatus aculeatus TaxID=481459 RepID=G3P9H2_GASAC|nr:CD63 antigen [Gasterosteus aculeatus aculeatus]
MAVEGGMKCIKFLVFFFNLIFWLCGLALIVVGILVQVSFHKSLTIHDVSASAAPIVIIVIGVVIFFIAFFGCCGAWNENYFMVTTFAIFLFLIIVVEIAAVIVGYVYKDKLSAIVQDSLNDMISHYNNGTPEFRKGLDQLQKDWKCCGVNNSSDWNRFEPNKDSVPDSCCVTEKPGCGNGTMRNPDAVHQKGCREALETLLKKNILWVIIAALVIAGLQILGIVFSCLLMKGIRSGYEVM